MNLAYQHFRRFVLIGICIALTWAFHAYAFCEEDSLSQDYGVSLKGLEDEATFYLYSKGTQLATIEYTRKPTGDVTARFTLSLADQTSRTETVITTDADGRWREIITTMPQGKIKAHRENLLVEQDVLSRRSTVTLQPDTLLYDNNIPGLFSDWVRRHREDGKKIKKISVYSAGAPLFHAAIETRESVNRLIEGQCRSLDRFTVYLPGLDTQLWTDDQGRVVMFDIPTQKSSFVRGGFESLLNKGEEDPSLSLPQHTVSVQKDIMIPMRDKVKLATDLYLPEGVSEFPVVLMRTPYGKAIMEIEGRFWAQRGYTCAIQDCRGRFKSQGVWVPFMHEAKDGYDTIEHLAAIPGCNGNVGMIGASYGGWVQWWAASLKPPHLKTMIPCVSPTDPQYNLPYEYGAFFLTGALWWAAVVEAEATADLSGKTMAEINKADYKKILNRLPVIDMDKALLGAENSYWRAWIKNAEDADYWRPACFLDGLESVDLPVFHQSGWYDGDGIGTKRNYLAMRAHNHANQKLILGPWGHTDTSDRTAKNRDFGREATLDLQREYVRWFDYWLKGINNHIMDEPLVSMFTMGSNEWHTGNSYPLEATRFTKLYLAGKGNANSGLGNGLLSWEPSTQETEFDSYRYDPKDPTPDPTFYLPDHRGDSSAPPPSAQEEKEEERAYHNRVVNTRKDILVYRTPPLKEPLTLCGPVSAKIYASSSAGDTDWFVSLSEETDTEEVFPLVCGKIRARYRTSMFKPELLEKGRIYEYDLDLWHTGITIPAGRRIRIEIASALFPMFSRNLNTGGNNEMETESRVAEQKVYHCSAYPSHILLPVLP